MALGGLKGRLLAGATIALFAGPALAADLSPDGVSLKDTPAAADALALTGYAQITSDYIFRGVSQNQRDPALQAGVDATYGLFYAGTFLSGVNFDAPNAVFKLGTGEEVDLYGGIRPKLGAITFDFGVITYNYAGTSVGHNVGLYDPFYYEGKAGASITVLKDLALSGTVYYSPNYFEGTGPAVTLEGTASKPITKIAGVDIAASGTIGYTAYSDSTAHSAPFTVNNYDYVYGNLGVTGTVGALSLDLRWWDTNLPSSVCDQPVFQCGSAFSATFKVAF
ncbi:MAG: TorF family putative porin [Rhodomicrobium sp.]